MGEWALYDFAGDLAQYAREGVTLDPKERAIYGRPEITSLVRTAAPVLLIL